MQFFAALFADAALGMLTNLTSIHSRKLLFLLVFHAGACRCLVIACVDGGDPGPLRA